LGSDPEFVAVLDGSDGPVPSLTFFDRLEKRDVSQEHFGGEYGGEATSRRMGKGRETGDAGRTIIVIVVRFHVLRHHQE
jgi:hypothetical protein